MNVVSRWLRRTIIWVGPIIVLLVVVLCGFLYWVVASPSGTRWALVTTAQQLDGHAGNVSGTLWDGVSVGVFSAALPDVSVRVERFHLQVNWRELLERRLHVLDLSAGLIDVDLIGAPKEDEPEQPFSMPAIPVSVSVDRVAVGQVHVRQHGEPLLPAELSNITTAFYLDDAGGQLLLRSLDLAHEQLSASLEGEARVLSLNDPWPLEVNLDLRAMGLTEDSPLCARRYLATLPAEQAREGGASARKPVQAGKRASGGTQAIADKPGAQDRPSKGGLSPAGSDQPKQDGADARAEASGMATSGMGEEGDASASEQAQQGFTPCGFDLNARAKGDLDTLTVALNGNGQGMRVDADARLTPRAAFPLERAVAAIELADGSTLHGRLDWEAGAQGDVSLDRLFGSLSTDSLNVGQLVGPALPDAVLTVDADFDLLLQHRSAVQSAEVAMAIAEDSRWNRQPLAGQLKAHVISSRMPVDAGAEKQAGTAEAVQAPAGTAGKTASAAPEAGPADAAAPGDVAAASQSSASDDTAMSQAPPVSEDVQPASGNVQLTELLEGLRLAALDMDITLGNNHLTTKGSLGQTDDSLELDVQAPELDAFWPDLPGGVTAKGLVAGTLADHKADLNVVYTPQDSKPDELGTAPADVHVELNGHWGKRPGSAAGADRLAPEAAGSSRQALPAGAVHDGTSRASETDAANASADTPQASKADVPPAPEGWRGTISRFDLKHAAFAANLNAPVNVSFFPGALPPAWEWEVGATTLELFMGSRKLVALDHAGSRGGGERWETRGDIDHLVVSRQLIEDVQLALGDASEKAEEKGGIKVRGQASDSLTEIDLALDWDLRFSGVLEGNAHVRRVSGDIIVPAEPSFPLGLKTFALDIDARRASSTTSLIRLDLDIDTDEKGRVAAQANTLLHADGMRLYLEPDDRKTVQVNASINDLAWLSLFTGDAMEFGGTLNADVSMESKPDGLWSSEGTIEGDKLRIVRIDDGIRLLDGTLRAHIRDDTLVLESLTFPARLRTTPKEWRTAEWVSSNPDAQDGSLTISGNWNLFESVGDIDVAFYRYPLLQRSDRYAMITGDLSLAIAIPKIDVKGSLVADAGWIDLDMLSSVPSLDSDVVVIRAGEDRSSKEAASPVDVSLELDVDLGPRFYLTGYGVNSGLIGKLHITMAGDKLTALGALHTRGGAIEAYGQRLQLRRGTITFQGDIASPVLDIEALRTGLAVEAGVRVAGTARRPRIDLVSYPAVSEIEKLSWLLLGHGPDDSGGDVALLFSVGTSFLSDGEPFYRRFGIDELSMRSGELGGAGSILPAESVVKGMDDAGSDIERRFVIASKSLSRGFTVSVRQALSDTGTVGHVSYQLVRGLTAELSMGTVNGLALVYRWFSRD